MQSVPERLIALFAASLFGFCLFHTSIASAQTLSYGLEWPGDGAVRRMLYWHNPFPIYDATYIFKVYHGRKPAGRIDTTRRFSGEMTAASIGITASPIPITARIHIRFLRPPVLVSGRFQSIAMITSPAPRSSGIAGTRNPAAPGGRRRQSPITSSTGTGRIRVGSLPKQSSIRVGRTKTRQHQRL